MKKILLLFVALLGVVQTWAYDVFIEPIYYNLNLETKEAEVTYADSHLYSGDISIPTAITVDRADLFRLEYFGEDDEFTVTSIGNSTFADCTNLNSVSIPSSVTVIGDEAFSNCSLSSVTLPNSVTTIGNRAFYGCHFHSFTIPSSVTTIGDGAFQYCYDYRFTSITIPSGVTSIGSGVFSQCYGLTEIIVEEGNSVYDSRNGCNAIIETSTNKLITGCKTTTIPNSVTCIGNKAFYGFDGVASITIPEDVTSIGNYAFAYCRDLTEIYLPSSVTSIGSYAFYYSSNLSSVVSYIETPFSFGSMAFTGISADCKLTIPYGTKDAYIAAGWTTDVFQGGIVEADAPTAVGDQFTAAVPLGSGTVDMTFKVTSTSPLEVKVGTGIGYSPCISKTSSGTLTIPSEVNGCTVTGIAYNAFYGCSEITSVSLPATLTTIEWCAFATMTGLKSIEIPEGVTDIPSYVFNGCTALEEIQLPSGLQSIGTSAFTSCQKLTTLTIPAGVTVISESLFRNCSALRSVVLLGNVTSIESNAFLDCSSLAELTVYATVPPSLGNSYSLRTTNVTLYVPAGSKSAYEAADYWKEFKEIIEMEGDEEPVEEIEVTDISFLINAIYIEPVTARIGGEKEVEICLKNAEAATAYTFDMVLPEGVTVAVNSNGKYIDALSDRHDDHTRTFNYKGDNTYSFATLSGNSEVLTGNDGAIRIVTLAVDEAAEEGTYAIDIKNASYSKPDGTLVTLPDTRTAITLESYVLGDVNGNGGVDIGDAVSIVNYLVGKESTTFVEKAADTNKNGQVDIGDAVTIVNLLVGKTASLSRTASPSTEVHPQ